MLDVARWGLGVDLPTRISAVGGNYSFNDDQQTPDTLAVQFAYPEKTILWEHRLWSSHGMEGRSSGVSFHGERGTLVVDRGGWKVYDHTENVTAEASELQSAHLRNFLDCVKSRQSPDAGLIVGNTASTLCHLGNAAYRPGREICFDPRRQQCDRDEAGNQILLNSAAIYAS